MPAPADTDAYLATVPEPQREALQVLRRQLLAAAPGATECVSYGMPAIRRTGVLVWFAAGKAHCALYPSGLVAEFADRLTGYQTSKGAIRFQPEKPLPPLPFSSPVSGCLGWRHSRRSSARRKSASEKCWVRRSARWWGCYPRIF